MYCSISDADIPGRDAADIQGNTGTRYSFMRLATYILNRAEDVAHTSEPVRLRHPDRANLSSIVVSEIEWRRSFIVDDCCVMRSIVELDTFNAGRMAGPVGHIAAARCPNLTCIAHRTAALADACSLTVVPDVGCGHERVVRIASVVVPDVLFHAISAHYEHITQTRIAVWPDFLLIIVAAAVDCEIVA